MRRHLLATLVVVACATSDNAADSAAQPATNDTLNPMPNQADSVRVADSLTVRTDKESYRPGETVKLTIVSASTARYTYNPCQRIVERESAGGWTAVREDRMCTMIAHLLEPKQTRNEETEMAEGIEPGRYRLVIHFTEDSPSGVSRSVRAATAPLTVVR
jgi:hypothetical protein